MSPNPPRWWRRRMEKDSAIRACADSSVVEWEERRFASKKRDAWSGLPARRGAAAAAATTILSQWATTILNSRFICSTRTIAPILYHHPQPCPQQQQLNPDQLQLENGDVGWRMCCGALHYVQCCGPLRRWAFSFLFFFLFGAFCSFLFHFFFLQEEGSE